MMKRPLSVWIVQVLISVTCLIFLPALLTWTMFTFTSLWASPRPPMSVIIFLVEFSIRFGVLCFLACSIFALAKRWPKCRLMGLAALMLLFALVAYSKFNSLSSGQGLPKFQLTSQAERGGAFIANIVMFIVFWILFFQFGFSKKAREYFSQKPLPRT